MIIELAKFWVTCAVSIIVIKIVHPLLLPLQLLHPSNCWWRILLWWILARQCPWCASPQVESRPRFSPGSAVTTACHRGAWWRAAHSHFRPSPRMRRESIAAWPATTWETRRRSPPPLWFEVRLSSLCYRIRAPSCALNQYASIYVSCVQSRTKVLFELGLFLSA